MRPGAWGCGPDGEGYVSGRAGRRRPGNEGCGVKIALWGGGPARALRVQSARPGCTSGGSWLSAAETQARAGVVVSLVLDRQWGCGVEIQASVRGWVLDVLIWQWGGGRKQRCEAEIRGCGPRVEWVRVSVWTAGDCLWVFRLRCGV